MSYIEKEKLIKADIASIENRVRHAFNQGYDLGFKDGKKRAKAFILDKIRAEIIERDKNIKSVRSDSCCFFTAEEVLEIIDKYKTESEDKT